MANNPMQTLHAMASVYVPLYSCVLLMPEPVPLVSKMAIGWAMGLVTADIISPSSRQSLANAPEHRATQLMLSIDCTLWSLPVIKARLLGCDTQDNLLLLRQMGQQT